MGILSNIFSGGASELVKTVGGVIDNLTTSKEEKEAAKLALQKEINRHAETMDAEANKVYEAELRDTQSARDANARIQESDKASWWAKNTAYLLDVFIGLIWGLITFFLVARALHLAETIQVDLTAVLSIYSTVTAIFMVCLNFHRGTSAGSAAKQKQIDRMVNR